MFGQCILKNRGFTLLETIGAFVVFVVLISVAYSLMLDAIKFHQRQENIVKNTNILFQKTNIPKKIYYIKTLHVKCQIFRYKNLKTIKFSQ